MSIQYLDIQETLPYLGRFLESENNKEQISSPSESTENPHNVREDHPPAQDGYLCQNPHCQYLNRRHELRLLYIYEISSEQSIIICDRCYDAGYRFCLFTHEVLHMNQLEPVLGDYFAQPDYNQGQLSPDRLKYIDNLYQYFQSIQLENPSPPLTIFNLREVDHL